jgi:hypothetical protein
MIEHTRHDGGHRGHRGTMLYVWTSVSSVSSVVEGFAP